MGTKAKKRSKKPGLGSQVASVISHPLRVKALGILNRRVASPSELSKELDVDLSLLSHHVKVLRDQGCIELVKTEQRRGAIEHYYRANVPAHFDNEAWAELSSARRASISKTVIEALLCETLAALNSGSLDAKQDRMLAWSPFAVDGAGWEEIVEMQLEMLERMEQIRVDAAERLLEAGDDGEQVVVAMMGFQRAES